MKSRRNFVVAILLVAIMCIGVGFAALNSTINGTGTITYTPAFNIEWKAGSVTGDKVTGSPAVSTDAHENDTLAFTVDTSDMVVGGTTTVEAKVKNTSKYNAKSVAVTPNTVTDTTDHCYTVVAAPETTTIVAGGEITVTFTITLKAYPQKEAAYNVAFNFSVTAVQDIPAA